MLKTVAKSSNKKLGGCAATYRAGENSVYDTCPANCSLKPDDTLGSTEVDREYLQAVLEGVPEGGVAWTYTHFWQNDIPESFVGQTCINISIDSKEEVESAHRLYGFSYPLVVVVPASDDAKVDRINDIRYVRCPAEYNSNITCSNCGGDTPLCARQDRDYVIKFTAHGNQAKKIMMRVEGGTETGGCYGNSGPVRLQWEKSKGTTGNDAQVLREFVASLPFGTKLRHHVVGDLG